MADKLSILGPDGQIRDTSSTSSATNTAGSSSHPNPFLDPKIAEHYRLQYEKSGYECRHEFDPSLEWSLSEEKSLIRRLDWRVSLWACIMFFSLNIDRKNLGQAVSDNLLGDLGLTTNDYNTGV